MGCLPTKTSVELRGGAGEAATLPAATAVSAGVMTAEHVKMLEKLFALHRTGGNGAAAGQTVVIEREAEPVDLTPLREEMALRLADVLSKIQGDVSRQIGAVRDETKQLIGAIKIEPPSVPAPAVSYDPAPLRSEFHAEIARVRKDFSQAVEKAYTDLAKRIERQSDIDPEELARQVQSVVSGEIDRAVAEAVQRIEERAPARTQLVEVEPGAFDETEPLPHFLDDWRKHGRREREEPEPETPEARRERAIRAIALAAEERRGAVTSPYPGKRDYYLRKAQIAFKQKMAPAQAYTDMLSPEAKRKGLTVDQLCDRIISRHYEAEAALQHIHDAEAEGTAAVMRATDEGIVAAERAAIERLASIGGDA